MVAASDIRISEVRRSWCDVSKEMEDSIQHNDHFDLHIERTVFECFLVTGC